MLFVFVFAVLVVVIDQVSKYLFYGSIGGSIIGNFLWFQSTLNKGIAFSWLNGKGWILIVFTTIAIGILVWFIFSKRIFKAKFDKYCLAIILGGAVSNLIDRIAFGGVRDFIYFRFIKFPIFNLADVAIVVTTIVFCIGILVRSIKKD